MEVLTSRPKSPPRIEAMKNNFRSIPEYAPGVLIGNWVEDGIECPNYENMQPQLEEKTDYSKLKPETRHLDFRVNKMNAQQGIMQAIIQQDERCLNNYLTTTDLVYNHQPKRLCGPEQKYYKRSQHMFYPQPDLMKCVGNLTNWGLLASKKWEWRCTDVSDYASTCFEDTYVAHPRSAFTTHRFYRDSRFTKSFKSLHSK